MILFISGLCIVHVDALPTEGAVFLDVNTDEIITRAGIAFLAHCLECQELRIAISAFIPFVNMSEESDINVPLLDLVQQEVSLLTGERGG